ncbi:MAG: DUF1553 domain-containing protein [Acidobacteriia bacterium]|nr:DUF1553 domain-containing protein [Terriglobia bacterium]
MWSRVLFAVGLVASLGWLFNTTKTVSVTAPQAAVNRVDFNRDIRPILSDTCFKCHGPDGKQRMANLRLDKTEDLFVDRGGYHIIVPGNSAQSKLYQKISSKDDSVRMPPVWSGRSLTEKQIELIKEWIDQGAKWETLWSFVPPKRPPVPAVKDRAWPRNPIDNFVLARLKAEGLKPSPETDKATLLRRVYFDLIGLPPTPAEIDAFVADRSPDAYEKRVDKLLASSHYGERMAMPWLDLARYADTHGYHIDSLRDMWAWRDWVIKAFNQNMPYDEFTIEQIAGDLLPHATLEQKIASGFNRNHMINFEGGAIPQEYHVEYLVDRVSTTSMAWLGLTMGCARCHDHKYDPIKQKDFYRFVAFFNTVPERGLDGMLGNADPVLPLPSHEQQARLDSLKTEIAKTLSALQEKQILAERNDWQKTALASIPEPSHQGLTAYYPLDGNLKDAAGSQPDAKVVRGEMVYDEAIVAQGADLSGETQVDFGGTGDFERSKPFALAFWTRPGTVVALKVLQKRTSGEHWQGWEVADEKPVYMGRLKRLANFVVRLSNRWPDNAIEVTTKEPQSIDAMRHLLVEYDGSGKASGLKLYFDGKPVETTVLKDQLSGDFRTSAPMEIGDKNLGTPYEGRLDDLRIYDRVLSDSEAEHLAMRLPARSLLVALDGRPAKEILPLQPEKEKEDIQIGEEDKAKTKEEIEKDREKDRQARLTEYFLSYGASDKVRQLYAQLKNLREEKEKLEESIPTVMIMAEMKKPRETFVLGRGQYDNPQEKVSPGVPSFLPPMAPGLPVSRLGLAKWIVDPGNPLTARVAVNHFWQEYFGIGLVKTSEDFGSQGEPPSNQPLLDWLATEFIRTGWNVKAMQRLIVTSATYRQSSRVTPELEERDPENRLLARGPRVRLPAELIRDNALAVSGLLDARIGGPSVYPYQPKGLWEEMAFGTGFTGQTYAESTGRDLYRRSMYTVWKRTVPPPALVTFDAPDREKCTARRTITNTPLQALVLMNDPTYVEAARVLAGRMLAQGGKTAEARINFAFRLATGRLPDPQERAVLVEAAHEALADYRLHPDEATVLLKVGASKSSPKLDSKELAAWTTVASMILNLDETITKE